MKKIDKYFRDDYENPNYVTVGPGNKTFYTTKMVFYVHYLTKNNAKSGRKKHIMGPYNEKTADIIMSELLKEGHCCWVEESVIR